MTALISGVKELDTRADVPRIRAFIADLSATPSAVAIIAELDSAERERASTFVVQEARESFVRRRWLRRALIASVFNIDAARIAIESDHLGCPRIVAPAALRSVSLSTSTAGRLALVALREGGRIGIDIASVDPSHATADAAAVFMSPRERSAWASNCDPGEFFRLWTRKEAALKALGTGFAIDPPLADVTGPTLSLRDPGSRPVVEILDIPAPARHAAALALARTPS